MNTKIQIEQKTKNNSLNLSAHAEFFFIAVIEFILEHIK